MQILLHVIPRVNDPQNILQVGPDAGPKIPVRG